MPDPEGGSGLPPGGPGREPPPPSRDEIIRRAGPYLGIGSTFLASIGVCLFGGWWLDRLLGTRPWLTVTGALVGITAGFYIFVKTVTSAGRPDGEEDR